MSRSVMRWMREVTTIAGLSATVAGLWLLVMVAGLWLLDGKTAGTMAQGAPAPTATVVRLADIPSHNGLYQAALIPSTDLIALDRPLAWTLEVRTATGAPVEGAALALETWMPDEGRVVAAHPRVTSDLGSGRYRVEGFRFDRLGWWNVKLAVAAPVGTDSLAFNLVFQDTAR